MACEKDKRISILCVLCALFVRLTMHVISRNTSIYARKCLNEEDADPRA
jgi:hypothetical protein